MYSHTYEANTICRICLNKEKNLIDIFSSTTNISSICLAIMECAPVLISKTDTLPHTICPHCLEKLENAYNFRILCIKSDQTLRNNVSIAVKNEDDSNDSKSEIDPIVVIKEEKGNNDDNDTKNREIESVVKKEENSCDEFQLNSNRISPERDHKSISLPGKLGNKEFAPVRSKKRPRSKLKDRKRKYEKCLLVANEDGYYHCKQCSRKYKHKFNLKEHLKVHLNFRHRCDQCGKEFDQNQYLKRHMLVHTTERKYACEFCGVLYRYKDNLRRHLRTHSTKREHQCEICEKEFTSREQLHKHSTIHKDERPWICENCGKGFKRKDHLALHEQTHGGKRFKCVQCSQTFLTRQNLKYHVIKICSRNS